MPGTGADARPAVLTKMCIKQYLRLCLLRFRVAAPCTRKRTAFKKYRSTYPKPIMNAVTLDIKDYTVFLVHGSTPYFVQCKN